MSVPNDNSNDLLNGGFNDRSSAEPEKELNNVSTFRDRHLVSRRTYRFVS